MIANGHKLIANNSSETFSLNDCKSIENKSILAMLKIELAENKINKQQKIKTNDGLVLEFIV